MAQHDYNIANQTASSARTDINNALAAIVSTNSGVAAPTTTVGNMIWYDTANNILQIRDEGNTAWITLGTVDQGNSKFEPNQTLATQSEAEIGTNNTKAMTALRVLQSITSNTVAPNFGTGNAALAYGAVGTYIFAGGYGYTLSQGSTYAGSGLYPVGVHLYGNTAEAYSGNGVGSALSGTWRAMGHAVNAIGNAYSSTLLLRIS
jgi:hypothetical protein